MNKSNNKRFTNNHYDRHKDTPTVLSTPDLRQAHT